MILTSQMKFDLGQLVITPAALEAVPADDICNAINRHICGDFGDLDAADRRENELALRAGLRLLSVYHATNGIKFWLITEADRRLTTILLPSDY
jgi:hypothetical protein